MVDPEIINNESHATHWFVDRDLDGPPFSVEHVYTQTHTPAMQATMIHTKELPCVTHDIHINEIPQAAHGAVFED